MRQTLRLRNFALREKHDMIGTSGPEQLKATARNEEMLISFNFTGAQRAVVSVLQKKEVILRLG